MIDEAVDEESESQHQTSTYFASLPTTNYSVGSNLSAFVIYKYITNSIGLFFSFLGLITFITIYRNVPRLVDRTTLRLQAALCFIDFLSHSRRFYVGPLSPGVCSFVGFTGIYLTSVSLTITTYITLCFHLNLLSTRKLKANMEKYFWCAIIILPLLHAVPPYALGYFGEDEHRFCFLKLDVVHRNFMIYYLIVVPNLLVFLYCLLILIFIVMRIKNVNEVLDRILDGRKVHENNRNLLQKIFDSWMSRFAIYPLSFILINSGLILEFILKSFQMQSTVVLYWTLTLGYLTGLANYIALMCDPYFQDAIIDIIFFKLDRHFEYRDKESLEDIALKIAKGRKHYEDGWLDTAEEEFIHWDEDEARALLQECTKEF